MKRALAAVAISILVSSCGDDGSSSAPIVTPTPTPTPSPTPTPTPTPSPTPTPTYRQIGFGEDFSLSGLTATLLVVRPSDGAPAVRSSDIQADPEQGRLTFVSNNEAATINFSQVSSNYTAADIVNRSDEERSYRRAGSSQDTLDIWLYRPNNRYVVLARQAVITSAISPAGTSENTRFFLSGAPTIATDIPQTGAVSRGSIGFRGSRAYSRLDSFFGGGGSATFTFASGTVSAGIDIVVSGGGPGGGGTGTVESGRLSFAGRIQSGVNRIDGTITGEDNFRRQYTGTFVGQFYGPQADEFGLVCRLTRDDGFVLVGVLYGQSR